jgi:hypothetical protein
MSVGGILLSIAVILSAGSSLQPSPGGWGRGLTVLVVLFAVAALLVFATGWQPLR